VSADPAVEPELSQESAPAHRRRRLVPVLALLLLVLLVTAGVLGWQVREQRAVERARAQALTAAESAAVRVLSYDHRTIAADVEAAEAVGTGAFLEQYRAATAGLAEQAAAGEVVVTATVQATSVQSAERGRVEALVFVDQMTARSDLEQPRVEQNRVRLTLERVDGRWLVSSLEAL
jgi:Mce-associated membrane protein